MRRLVQSEDLRAAILRNRAWHIGNRSSDRSNLNAVYSNGSHEHSQDHVESAAVQLKPHRVLALRDGGGSVLRAGTVLISSPIFRSLRRRLYRSHSPINVQLSLSTSRRWRAHDHAVHTHAGPDRKS
jgi:hypothetical protein